MFSDSLIIFDSFGKRRYSRGLEQCIRRLGKHSTITRLDLSLQSANTQVCGQWAIFFLILLYRGINIKYVIKLLDQNDKLSNDRVIHSVFDKFNKTVFIG